MCRKSFTVKPKNLKLITFFLVSLFLFYILIIIIYQIFKECSYRKYLRELNQQVMLEIHGHENHELGIIQPVKNDSFPTKCCKNLKVGLTVVFSGLSKIFGNIFWCFSKCFSACYFKSTSQPVVSSLGEPGRLGEFQKARNKSKPGKNGASQAAENARNNFLMQERSTKTSGIEKKGPKTGQKRSKSLSVTSSGPSDQALEDGQTKNDRKVSFNSHPNILNSSWKNLTKIVSSKSKKEPAANSKLERDTTFSEINEPAPILEEELAKAQANPDSPEKFKNEVRKMSLKTKVLTRLGLHNQAQKMEKEKRRRTVEDNWKQEVEKVNQRIKEFDLKNSTLVQPEFLNPSMQAADCCPDKPGPAPELDLCCQENPSQVLAAETEICRKKHFKKRRKKLLHKNSTKLFLSSNDSNVGEQTTTESVSTYISHSDLGPCSCPKEAEVENVVCLEEGQALGSTQVGDCQGNTSCNSSGGARSIFGFQEEATGLTLDPKVKLDLQKPKLSPSKPMAKPKKMKKQDTLQLPVQNLNSPQKGPRIDKILNQPPATQTGSRRKKSKVVRDTQFQTRIRQRNNNSTSIAVIENDTKIHENLDFTVADMGFGDGRDDGNLSEASDLEREDGGEGNINFNNGEFTGDLTGTDGFMGLGGQVVEIETEIDSGDVGDLGPMMDMQETGPSGASGISGVNENLYYNDPNENVYF